jgi:hypothetical protein
VAWRRALWWIAGAAAALFVFGMLAYPWRKEKP